MCGVVFLGVSAVTVAAQPDTHEGARYREGNALRRICEIRQEENSMTDGENGLSWSRRGSGSFVPDGVKVTKLTEGEYRKLLAGRRDSKSLRD